MSKKIAIILVIFILVTFTPSCRNDNAPPAVPAYKQIGQTPELKGPFNAQINSKGQIVLWDYGEVPPVYAVMSPQGEIISKVSIPMQYAGYVFTLDPHDNIYIVEQEPLSNSSQKNKKTVHAFNSSGENIKTIKLTNTSSQRDFSYSDIAVDSKGNIYLLRFDGTIEMLDGDGKNIKTFSLDKYDFIEVDHQDNLIVCGQSNANEKPFIEVINTLNGKSIWKCTLRNQVMYLGYNKASKYIFTAEDEGIKKYEVSGKAATNLMEYSKNPPPDLLYVSSINIDPDGSIYFTLHEGNTIYKYELLKDSELSEATPLQEQKKVVTFLTSLAGEELQMINKAVQLFTAKHNGIEINVGSYDRTSRNEIMTLFTKIMSGNSPDIIDVTYLPYRKLCEKQILLDLDEMFDNDTDLDKSLYYTNIVDAARINGKIYSIPLVLRLNVTFADKQELENQAIKIDDEKWTSHDFLDICKTVSRDVDNDGVKDKYAFVKIAPSSLFKFEFQNYCEKFIDFNKKVCSLNSPEFIDFLNKYKEIYPNIIHPDINVQKFFEVGSDGEIVFFPVPISSYGIISNYQILLRTKDVDFFSYPDLDGSSYNPDLAPAICRKTKYSNEAWEFIKILMSDDVLKDVLYGGITINKSVNEKFKAEVINRKDDALDSEDIEKVDKYLAKCNKAVWFDEELTDILIAEINTFFSENKTAEDTAAAIQNKVNTYLNE